MATPSAITQRAFLTGARLALSRLRLDGDLPSLYRRAAEISARALNVGRVGVWWCDGGQKLRCLALFDAQGAAAPPPLEVGRLPEYLSAVKAERFVAVPQVATARVTAELAEYCKRWNIGALLDAAVYRNGEVVGIVCHEHLGGPREWTREECQFAATVADLISYLTELEARVAAQEQAYELQLRLKDAHRLDALGRMAAGIAHDLNNMLGVITGGIELLRAGTEVDVLEPMAESARHAAQLVAQLMSLSRKQTPQAVVQPLDPLLEQLARLLVPRTPAGVQVVFDVEKGLSVWADAAQLQQVLINLCENAFQALRKGGPVAVRARPEEGGVLFEVVDGGEGIAAENLDRLFDPFFTTRHHGHGIGLAVVQQLVTQHGGEVTVSSAPGEGSTFRVWWPSGVPG